MRVVAGVGRRSRALAFAGTVLLTLILAACGGTDAGPDATPSAPAGPVVVTFEVAGGERFKALLTHADDIAIARQLLAGEDAPGIPNGRVVRTTGVNTGYTWSMDPEDFEFASVTVEVCDGLPSDVESGDVTSDRYCPWSAQVVAIEPAS